MKRNDLVRVTDDHSLSGSIGIVANNHKEGNYLICIYMPERDMDFAKHEDDNFDEFSGFKWVGNDKLEVLYDAPSLPLFKENDVVCFVRDHYAYGTHFKLGARAIIAFTGDTVSRIVYSKSGSSQQCIVPNDVLEKV